MSSADPAAALEGGLYRLILDSALDAIITIDEDGKVLDWNRQAEEMFGYPASEAKGSALAPLIVPERHRQAHAEGLARFRATGEGRITGRRIEMPALRRDGTEFWVELTVAPSRIDDRWIFCSFLRDISRQRLEKDRQALQAAVTSILARSPDSRAALPQLLEAVCSHSPWVFGAYWRVADRQRVLACEHLFSTDRGPMGEFVARTRALRLRAGEGLPGRVLASGAPEWMEDVSARPDFVRRREAEAAGLRTAFAFPVRLDAEVAGVFEFFTDHRHPLDPDFLALTEALSGQVGLFLVRKRAEEALAAERARFADLLGSVDSIVWEADARTGRFTFVSPQAERILGYPVELWLAEGFWEERIHPDDRRHAVDACMRGISEKRPTYDFRYRMVAADGSVLWFHDYVTLALRDGEPESLRGLLVDVTREVLASEERQRSQEQLDAILQGVGDAVTAHDADGRLVYANGVAAKLLGYQRAEDMVEAGPELYRGRFLGIEVVGGRTLDPGGFPLWKQLGVDQPPATLRFRLAQAPAEDRYVVARHQGVRDASGGLRLVICTYHDITGRVKAELEVERQIRLIRSITDNATSALFLMDSRQHCTFMNPAAERMTGYTFAETQGRPLHDVVHHTRPDGRPYPLEECPIDRALPERSNMRGEDVFVRRDGSFYPVAFTASPFLEDGRPVGTVIEVMDITERKAAEQARRATEERLHQAQKMEAVGRLAGGIAHDFNNLLTAINGYSGILLNMLPEGSQEREFAAEVGRAGGRAASLTQQLLAYSRKQVIQKRVLSVEDAMRSMESMLGRLIGEDVLLEVRTEPGLGRVEMDPGQLEQVILNLALNARDAMPRGGRLVIEARNAEIAGAPTAAQLAPKSGPQVMLSVEDSGAGMDADTLAHLFEPFFTTKEPGKGTGLGLSTVYSIVEQAEGGINVDSAPGRGTRFQIYLPAVSAAPSLPDNAAPVPEPASAGPRETLLVVEDEDVVRKFMRQVLEAAGYSVLEASGGREALEAHGRAGLPFHLLITDVVMPGMGGAELAEEMGRLRPEVPVLFVSGYTANASIAHRLGAGADFLQKPFTAADLLAKAAELLRAGRTATRP